MKVIRGLYVRARRAEGMAMLFLILLSISGNGQMADSLHQPSGATRPNIVFIYTDDQRYDALSVIQEAQGLKGRFPWFKTPNIDRIAKEGVCFKNAFVINSLCSPSRATMLTGRY